MNIENTKKTYIIANTEKADIIDLIKNTITDVQYEYKFSNVEQLIKPGLIISEDSLRLNIKDGLKIKRMRKKVLILCKNADMNSKFINDIKNTYGKIFYIYIETIDDIYKHIKNNNTDSFAFRNILYDLFKSYKDADYLIII